MRTLVPALLFALLGVWILPTTPALAAARITIVNINEPGEGFNDPTPVAPVGGNSGTTRGEQRLIAFEHAAALWGAQLDTRSEIFIDAGFFPLPCFGGSAVLGAAGPVTALSDFPGAEFPRTLYPIALANKRALVDLVPGPPGGDGDDISAFFSTSIDGSACLGPRGWYYGLDNQHGADIDLVAVLLHEFAHGLGFASFTDETTGAGPVPDEPDITDIYSRHLLDTSLGRHWNEMTQDERAASAVNVRKVVWDGEHVTRAVPTTLRLGTPNLWILAPASLAGAYDVGSAAFGPALAEPGLTAPIAAALDAADPSGPSTTDGCSPYTNAPAVAGRIALVDRGTCTFTAKAQIAQAAGAVAVIVADTAPGRPPGTLGGADTTIVIPTVRITQADGNAFRAALAAGASVTATLGVDPTLIAGADAEGRALVNVTDPVQPGSSISHWDPIALPNQLMEPAINTDLTHEVDGVDLTLSHLRDIGWYADSDLDGADDADDPCLGSDLRSTVIVDGCDSTVPNAATQPGCTIADEIARCAADARNHGTFVSCATGVTTRLRRDGILTNTQRSEIQRCVAHAR